ncbi:hypothetical protein LOK49_LG07G02868 [Camellia lanceoleosa]|uniref:Uncharacterized protein n=1 Tax=Camellia lanceoleosa TaxID=1840588 RepID=A0ACC0H6M7_9ERIC|nr:hypothetical protein LOK49_LG07G02868 [Camellia lanceoleosa]
MQLGKTLECEMNGNEAEIVDRVIQMEIEDMERRSCDSYGAHAHAHTPADVCCWFLWYCGAQVADGCSMLLVKLLMVALCCCGIVVLKLLGWCSLQSVVFTLAAVWLGGVGWWSCSVAVCVRSLLAVELFLHKICVSVAADVLAWAASAAGPVLSVV